MNPVNNTAIPIKDINSVPQVFTPTSTVNPFDYTSPINQVQTDIFGGVQNAQNQVNQLTEQAKQKSSSIATLESLLGNKAQDTTNLYDTTGVTNLYNQLSDLNAQATGLKNEAAAIPIQVQQQALGQGVTDRGIAPIETAKLRDNALKALSLGQQYAIVSGNYDKARNYADQLITAKYSQIEANINARKTDLAALEKYDLTPAQTKLLNAQNAAIKKQEQELADKKANEKAISDMIINASSANAPRDLVSKAQAAKTPSEAAMILGQYAGDYYKTELLKNQIATEKAQRAKIYNDINNSNSVPVTVDGVIAKLPKASQERYYKLQGDFDKATEKYRGAIDSANSLKALSKDATAQDQTAIIFQYMKTLDPTSTVREGEFALVASTAGLGDRAVNALKKLDNGQRLNDTQIKEIVGATDKLAQSARQNLEASSKEYDRRAVKFGLPTGLFYEPQDLSSNVPIINKSENPAVNAWYSTTAAAVNNVGKQPATAATYGFTDNQTK